MAKTSMVEREKRRAKIVQEVRRQAREAQGAIRRPEASPDEPRRGAGRAAEACRATRARAAAATAARSPAVPRGVYRKFGLARTKIREIANRGEIPGVVEGELVRSRSKHEHDRSSCRPADAHPQRADGPQARGSLDCARRSRRPSSGPEGRGLCGRLPHRRRSRASRTLTIDLKYFEGRPVIDRLERISRPGLRIYRGKDELPKVLGGLGTVIVSTPQGVMTDKPGPRDRAGRRSALHRGLTIRPRQADRVRVESSRI